MTTEVITALPEDTVKELAERMLKNDISALPVVDRDGYVKGIVTEADIILRVDVSSELIDVGVASLGKLRKMFKILDKKTGAVAEEIMTTHLISVDEDTPVTQIAGMMVKHRVRNVLVVKEGKLIGMVGRKNILRLVLTGDIK